MHDFIRGAGFGIAVSVAWFVISSAATASPSEFETAQAQVTTAPNTGSLSILVIGAALVLALAGSTMMYRAVEQRGTQ